LHDYPSWHDPSVTGPITCAHGCTHDNEKPRLAEPGIQVCSRCERRVRDGLRDLPTLWAELGDPRKGKTARIGGASAEHPQQISDEARNARSAIRASLVDWCLILEQDCKIGLPSEQAIAATTRLLVHGEDMAARLAADPAERARHQERAAELRESRETGADIITGICDHIARQASVLLAQPEHADQLVHDIETATSEAWRLARPGRRRTIPCVQVIDDQQCDGHVVIDEERLMECPACGTYGALVWWREQVLAAMRAKPLTLAELPDYLLIYHGMQVPKQRLRTWADEGVIHPIEASVSGKARLFDGPAVSVVALARLG
jgi:hypothetical protein